MPLTSFQMRHFPEQLNDDNTATIILNFFKKLNKLSKEAFPELSFLQEENELQNIGSMHATKLDDKTWTMCLNIALYLKQHEVVDALLAYKGPNDFQRDSKGQMPMHFAVMSEDVTLLKKLCNLDPKGINYADNKGNTPLHHAVYNPSKTQGALVAVLLETARSLSVDIIDYQNKKKETVLHYAVHQGCYKTIALLLQAKAAVNVQDDTAKTPMHIAAQNNLGAVAELLLQYNADIKVQDKNGRTPLHVAAKEGHTDFVQRALANDIDIDAKDFKNETVLQTTLRWHTSKQITEKLRERLKNIGILLVRETLQLKKEDNTHKLLTAAICRAIIDNNFDILILCMNHPIFTYVQSETKKTLQKVIRLAKWCLKNGNNMRNFQDIEGLTPLHTIAQYGSCEAVEAFLKLHNVAALVNAKDHRGITSLHVAAQRQDDAVAIARLLLQHNADITIQDIEGLTPLHMIAQYSSYEAIEAFLAVKGVSSEAVNATDCSGMTPLHIIAQREDANAVKIAQLLLEHNADINFQNIQGQTPLHTAVRYNSPAIEFFLKDEKLEMDIKDCNGQTAFHIAAEEGNIDSMELLLDYGLDCDIQDNNGQTAFHIATQTGEIESIALLVDYRVDCNIQDNNGQTVLHMAIERKFIAIVYCLFKHPDIQIDVQNYEGITPLLSALLLCNESKNKNVSQEERNHLQEIAIALLKMGADRDIIDQNDYTVCKAVQCIVHPNDKLIALLPAEAQKKTSVFSTVISFFSREAVGENAVSSSPITRFGIK